jgi:hypothetical protein
MKPAESLESGVLSEKVRGRVRGASGGDDSQSNSDKRPRKSSTVRFLMSTSSMNYNSASGHL